MQKACNMEDIIMTIFGNNIPKKETQAQTGDSALPCMGNADIQVTISKGHAPK